ncbi:uncharacterized protein LOC100186321 [Ciona intestinalis]
MSVFLFAIGVIMFYFLYVTYDSDSKKQNTRSRTQSFNCSPTANTKDRIYFAVRRYFYSIVNPINNNYEDGKPDPFLFRAFSDRFQTFEDVSGAMVDAGIKKCQLILGIDFTASNEWQGRVSNRGQSLHNITQKFKANQNPYQHVITILQHTLKDMVDANVPKHLNLKELSEEEKRSRKLHGIHAFGFGDSVTKDISTFCLQADGMPCGSFDDVLHCYRECASKITLGGPTSYAPVVHKAIEIVEQTNQYNILVIIADGQFVDEGPTARAIVEASYYPLSIIVVGVGDGPWETMHQFDDWLPERNFDNFQFVEYGKIISNTYDKSKNPETMLALHMLMEIPDQYKIIHKLGYMSQPHHNVSLDS